SPFVDTTRLTETILPATATGVTFDLGIILLGLVLPFWSVVGTFAAILLTATLNPILHRAGILHTWQPGMDTVNTTFSANMDFWLSFGIGAGAGIAVVCVISTIRQITAQKKANALARQMQDDVWKPPDSGRGDCSIWVALGCYCVAALALVAMCYALLPKTIGMLFFLMFFAFGFTPLITYVNAKLLGIAGQWVEIPFVKEGAFLLSGAKGIDIWLAPVPLTNYGWQSQQFRVNEYTGVRFWSLVKTELVALPVLFFLSLVFWSFIWQANMIPSQAFPAAQVNWELMAKNQALMYSATFVAPGEDPGQKNIGDSEFMKKAFHPKVIGAGFAGCVGLYALLSVLGLPVMLVFGMIRGWGELPHYRILELVGALLGRYYFQKRYGTTSFLQNAPALLAGYYTGVGLISMATIAMNLIKSAVSAATF
ncbi:MAG: peptide transporter, partial [Candidatus Hydrogenedentes bacterium]|nr:peptide transporter [Candidatus Hydrogenedentota bacterium]